MSGHVVTTILVVEDDETVGASLQVVLEADSYQVEQATHLGRPGQDRAQFGSTRPCATIRWLPENAIVSGIMSRCRWAKHYAERRQDCEEAEHSLQSPTAWS